MTKKEAGATIRPDKPISEAAIRRAAKALLPLLQKIVEQRRSRP